MKTLSLKQFKSIAIIIAIISSGIVYAQNDNVLDVYGKGQVHGKLIADSLHVKTIEIGNSIFVGANPGVGSFYGIFTDDTPPADLFIQSCPSYSHNTILNYNPITTNPNGRVGIGLNTPNNLIQVRDLINFDNALGNTFLGFQAGNSFTSGLGLNTAIGFQALQLNTTGYSNTANGEQALNVNTTGYNNTAIGVGALSYNTEGYNNTAIGVEALNDNNSGYENTANGSEALENNYEGHSNTANGVKALFTNNAGWDNTANGVKALYINTSGNWNTANGGEALYNNTIGSDNTADGLQSLLTNETGWFNTALGYKADVSSPGLNNATAIGANSRVNASNSLVLGSFSIINGTDWNVNVGIGTSNPFNRLEIATTASSLSGVSGLRLTTLDHAHYPNITGSTQTALTVNSDGDVILCNISANSGAGFGLPCPPTSGGPLYNLSDDWRVGLGPFNFYFDDQVGGFSSAKSSVGIGYLCTDLLYAKLNVKQTE